MKSAIPPCATAIRNSSTRTPACTIPSIASTPSTSSSSTAPHTSPRAASSIPSWRTTHQHFVEYGRNAKEWTKKCILLLPEIQKQQIWKKKRFSDIYDYARKMAGISHHQVNEALRILGKAENLPAIRKVIEEKGINAVKPIIAIATASTDQFWAKKSQIMGQHPLEAYVKGFRMLQSVTGLRAEPPQSVTIHPQATIIMQLDPSVADQLGKLKGSGTWNDLMKKFLALNAEELERSKPTTVETSSRTIPAAIRKHVLAKTNSTCAFPGCQKPHKILHHTDRFAMYHRHDPDTIVPLCEAHERLAHLGLIKNEQEATKEWQIRSAPDYDTPEYEIDQVVGKYRQPT